MYLVLDWFDCLFRKRKFFYKHLNTNTYPPTYLSLIGTLAYEHPIRGFPIKIDKNATSRPSLALPYARVCVVFVSQHDSLVGNRAHLLSFGQLSAGRIIQTLFYIGLFNSS